MVNFLIRRFFQIVVVTFLVCLASYVLFYNAPGGPLQQLAEINQGGRNRLDPQAFERVQKRYDLDLYHIPRFLRWFTGYPRDAVQIGGAVFNPQVGCGQEAEPGTKVKLQFEDGTVIESDCVKPIFLSNLPDPIRRTSDGIIRGDFGLSQQIMRDQPVSKVISSRIGPTLLLMGLSNFLALVIAIPIGVYSAARQYSKFDYLVTTVTFFFSAMPTLLLGIMGILIFAVTFQSLGLPYLPAQLAFSDADKVVPIIGTIKAGSALDRIWHLILPVSVLTLVSLTGWSRFIRSSMLEVLKQDYVRTARAKGLYERAVIIKHALRNSLIPFVTLVVGILPALFGGAFVTETIFSWPGLGRVFVDALGRSDYPVSMAVLLLSTVLTLVGFLISDVLYTVVDPRIRVS
jgi:peptide/nickel transport system permease protein